MKGKIIKGIAGFYYVHAVDVVHAVDFGHAPGTEIGRASCRERV